MQPLTGDSLNVLKRDIDWLKGFVYSLGGKPPGASLSQDIYFPEGYESQTIRVPGNVILPNVTSYMLEDQYGDPQSVMYLSAGDQLYIGQVGAWGNGIVMRSGTDITFSVTATSTLKRVLELNTSRQAVVNPDTEALSATALSVLQDRGGLSMDIQNVHNGADGLAIRMKDAGSLTTGNMFIGFYTASWAIQGQIRSDGAGGVAYLTTSDKRLKTKVDSISQPLDLLMKLEPVSYEMKSTPGVPLMGFLAQDLYEVVPEAVGAPRLDIEVKGVPIEPWGVDNSKLVPLLVSAVQELTLQVRNLERRLVEHGIH